MMTQSFSLQQPGSRRDDVTFRDGVAGSAPPVCSALRGQTTPVKQCPPDAGLSSTTNAKLDLGGEDVQGPGDSRQDRVCRSPGWGDCWSLHSARHHTR